MGVKKSPNKRQKYLAIAGITVIHIGLCITLGLIFSIKDMNYDASMPELTYIAAILFSPLLTLWLVLTPNFFITFAFGLVALILMIKAMNYDVSISEIAYTVAILFSPLLIILLVFNLAPDFFGMYWLVLILNSWLWGVGIYFLGVFVLEKLRYK
jgi:hypothetical protein